MNLTGKWQRSFFAIWTGQQISLIGSVLGEFALIWWVTKTTGSATILAMATLLTLLPQVFLGPFTGALVDRWNRRRVMMVADAFVAAASAALAYLAWSQQLAVWHLYLIMVARALGGIFHWPAMQASTALMVPKEHLPRVAGLNQTVRGALNIAAPPLGALLVGALPLHGIMLIDVLTALVAIVPLWFVQIPQPVRQPVAFGTRPTLLHDVKEGMRYVWHWPGAFALLVIASLINLLVNPAFVLMPILVTKHFGGEAMQLGALNSAWGVGIIVGGTLLSIWGGFRRRIVTSLTGIVGMGVGILAVGLAPATLFPMALVGLMLAGTMNPIANGPIHAILQSVVAPEMQGRVFMLIGSMAAAMTPLSMVVAGPVADAVGVRVWYVVGGVGCLLMGLICFLIPTIMSLEEQRAAPATAPQLAVE
mgnify:CR=1 FL=1